MRRLAATLPVMIFSIVGCGANGQEEQVLRRFFDAARAGDRTMLSKVATVTLSPVTDGTIRDFAVIGTAEEKVEADRVTKSVTVRAQVHTPSNQMITRTLVFTFQRHHRGGDGRTGESHWIITEMQ